MCLQRRRALSPPPLTPPHPCTLMSHEAHGTPSECERDQKSPEFELRPISEGVLMFVFAVVISD